MSPGDLLRAAAAGDEAAWNEIVDRFSSLVWATARAHRLSRDDAFEAPDDETLDRLLLDGERDGALWRAFARLSERCKTLLRLLIADEEPSYEEVGAALGMPVGAIGPTRMRCLDKLRRTTEIAKLEA